MVIYFVKNKTVKYYKWMTKKKKKIERFREKIEKEVCSNVPNALWHKKKHVVKVPYIKEFSWKKISKQNQDHFK